MFMGKTGKWKAQCSGRAAMQLTSVQGETAGRLEGMPQVDQTHLVTTVTLYKGKKFVVPPFGPQFLLLMCRYLFLPHGTQQNSLLNQNCPSDNWSGIAVRCHQLHLRDCKCFWPHSQQGHWVGNTLKWVFNFHPLLYKISFTHRKSQDTVLLLGHCSSPHLSWQGHIFPENCMKQLTGFWFQLGSDFVLRHGFSLTEEMHEVDKSWFLYSPKTPLLILRCLVLKFSFPVTLS